MADTIRTARTTGATPVARTTGTRWVLPVALLLALAPFALVALRFALHDAPFQFAGDQAVIGLSVHHAGALGQELGPYSRYGWSHPGPSWYYLMAPWARLLGGDDSALVAASLVVHGLVAAALVAAVHRRGRPILTLAAAGLLLVLVLRLPTSFFVDVWNPFALLLATALFLVVAARARDGRWTTLLAVLVVGSHLVQTHVGTAPLVLAVGLAAGVAFLLGRRDAGRDPGREDDAVAGGRRRRVLTAGLAVLLVAMWVPPLVQQLTAPPGQGNLGRIVEFFTSSDGGSVHPTAGQAVIAVGRLLAMPVYGWDPGPWEMDVSTLPAAVALVLVAQVLGALVLVAAGRRYGSPGALWTGVVVLVALLAAVASGRTVSGTLYWYLLVWVCVLPGVSLIGLAQLLLDRRSGPAVPRSAGAGPVLVGTALVGGALAVVLGVQLDRGLAGLPDSAGVQAAGALVDDALDGRPTGVVYVDIHSHDRWPIGAGVIEELAEAGWDVRVNSGSADLFGTDRVGSGTEPVRLTLVAPDDPALATVAGGGAAELGTVPTENGPVTVFLTTPR